MITPGEAGTIAAVVDTFVRAIETSDFERRLKIVEAEYQRSAKMCRECLAPRFERAIQPLDESLL